MFGLFGLAALLALAWCLSAERWHIPYRVVLGGVALQIGLAVLLIKFPPATAFFFMLDDGVAALQKATDAGTGLVFGYLGGAPLPFAEVKPGASFILAFKAFPLVLVISALASLLLYWGILQRIVAGFAFVLRRTLGVGGALGLGAAVHIFVGMVEAPLLIRPYLLKMQRGELFALMSCGMAGIAGTVMVIYASLLGPVIPDALGHILIASVISTPGALAMAAIMVPFDAGGEGCAELVQSDPPSSFLEAIARGTNDGIFLVASIIAMLIVIVALVQLFNAMLGLVPHGGFGPFTLQQAFAAGFRPLLWLVGHRGARSGRGGPAHGDQDRRQRVRRLSGFRPASAGRLEPALEIHHDLRAVRLRQFRQRGDHDRRHERDGAGAAGGDRGVGSALDYFGNLGYTGERRNRGDVDLRGRR